MASSAVLPPTFVSSLPLIRFSLRSNTGLPLLLCSATTVPYRSLLFPRMLQRRESGGPQQLSEFDASRAQTASFGKFPPLSFGTVRVYVDALGNDGMTASIASSIEQALQPIPTSRPILLHITSTPDVSSSALTNTVSARSSREAGNSANSFMQVIGRTIFKVGVNHTVEVLVLSGSRIVVANGTTIETAVNGAIPYIGQESVMVFALFPCVPGVKEADFRGKLSVPANEGACPMVDWGLLDNGTVTCADTDVEKSFYCGSGGSRDGFFPAVGGGQKLVAADAREAAGPDDTEVLQPAGG